MRNASGLFTFLPFYLFTFLPFYFFTFLPLKAAAASYTECGSDSCEKGDCNLQNCFPGTCFHNLYFFNVKCLMLIGWGAHPARC